MGYQIPIFKEYVNKYNAEVIVVHWNNQKFTPYLPPVINGVHYYNRSEFSAKKLKEFAIKTKPDVIYISGWMDMAYLVAVRPLRKIGIPVVTGIDDIWWKTIRQRIASFIFPLFRKLFFSHAWVAGPYQYEFAKRLGFRNNEIIFNCLSADTDIFNLAFNESIEIKKTKYPHRFLYVGRFESIKGVDILIKAWANISNQKNDWELCVIGNGSLYNSMISFPDLNLVEFMQPDLLAHEIKKYGCFVLPSRKEAWSLVLHEFSAAGLPIICSNICGAAPVFLIPKYNGYLFEANNVKDLETKMLQIINSSDQELLKMSENSHLNGQKINPKMSAACFMSIVNK